MNNHGESRGPVRAVVICSLVVVFGLTIFLESKQIQIVKPRFLSMTPSNPFQLNATHTAIHPSFMEAIDCGLPIRTGDPPKAMAHHATTSEIQTSQNTCVRFFPERFFKNLAAPFQMQYNYSKGVKTEHPVIHMTLQNHSRTNSKMVTNFPTTLTYFHIRKCGGTTMFRSLSSKSIHVPYTVNKYNRMVIDELGIVKDIYQRQTNGQEDTAVVFSFVRDPVVRFLSSAGQMLHMNKIRNFPDCMDQRAILQDISLRESNATIGKSQALVHCMLKSMKSHLDGKNRLVEANIDFLDQHLLPQAFELRARSLEYDIGIHLMSMDQIATTLKALVGSDRQNRHARPSRVADYTQGYFLETSILNKDMIRDICDLYAVDVLLLKVTGVTSTLCDVGAPAES